MENGIHRFAKENLRQHYSLEKKKAQTTYADAQSVTSQEYTAV